ncbi:MAG: hypothetical protein ACOVQ8_09790 [Elstera sp.]|jgi:hypothetical protein|uniref:hypothetical protein n=1 Tax=Elstera sp. TaxID=1916664 RepID=UPI0037BFA6F4
MAPKRPDFRMKIATAIRQADTRYFFEDYTKQAEAVLRMLAQEGYVLVPGKPSDEIIEYAKDNLPYGRQRPEDMLRALYGVFMDAGRGAAFKRKPPPDEAETQ